MLPKLIPWLRQLGVRLLEHRVRTRVAWQHLARALLVMASACPTYASAWCTLDHVEVPRPRSLPWRHTVQRANRRSPSALESAMRIALSARTSCSEMRGGMPRLVLSALPQVGAERARDRLHDRLTRARQMPLYSICTPTSFACASACSLQTNSLVRRTSCSGSRRQRPSGVRACIQVHTSTGITPAPPPTPPSPN
ncbi:hypothetical protein DFH06DRAFT_1204006 [Mycena polygramma]|nr:hypothetical protein DFH06DRAFT_1204006 [Mycena polygramma]